MFYLSLQTHSKPIDTDIWLYQYQFIFADWLPTPKEASSFWRCAWPALVFLFDVFHLYQYQFINIWYLIDRIFGYTNINCNTDIWLIPVFDFTNINWGKISKTSITDAVFAEKEMHEIIFLRILTLRTCFPSMFDLSTVLKLCWNSLWGF